MSFELPARQGRSKRPVPAISIGARRRGKSSKLTPYILFTADAAGILFGSCTDLELTIGAGDDEGWVQLIRGGEGAGNVKLRQQSKVNEDLVVESRLIPHDGKTAIRRIEADIEPLSGENMKAIGVRVKLPWGRPGFIRSKAASQSKTKQAKKDL